MATHVFSIEIHTAPAKVFQYLIQNEKRSLWSRSVPRITFSTDKPSQGEVCQVEVVSKWKTMSHSGMVVSYNPPNRLGVRYLTASAEVELLYSLADHRERTILTSIEEIIPTTKLRRLTEGKGRNSPRKSQIQDLEALKLLIEAPIEPTLSSRMKQP